MLNSGRFIKAANRIGMNNKPTSQGSDHDWRIVAGVTLALALATFLVYLPTRQFEFLNWDDQSYVVENDHVKGGLTWQGIVWAFTQSHSANWHPLTWLSHALDCQLYGLQPSKHHTTNVLLHAINAALLFHLMRTLTGSLWRSALVAGIFALHPLRVESVAWVSERKDLLSMFFGISTLLAYARYVTESKAQSPKSKIWYSAAVGLFACGLMSKPMLVTWPFVILLLDFWPLRRIEHSNSNDYTSALRGLLVEKLPFFALAIGSCIATLIAQKQGGAVASFEHLPISYRLQNALVAYATYLKALFWPTQLAPIYPHPAHWASWRVGVALVVLLGLSFTAWKNRIRFPCGIIGWLWFLGTLVPVIGIVQVGSQAFADRYTYIPQIGLVLSLVWLGALLTKRLPKVFVTAMAGIILTTLAWLTSKQLSIWKNTETLFKYTLEFHPNNTQALYGLGSHYLNQGRLAEGKQLLEKVIQFEPDFVEAQGALADALDGEGRHAEAAAHYEAALARQPNNASLLNNLAWLRAACPDAAIRNGNQAVELAKRACELSGYTKPIFIGTLAAAQAEAGDFQAATATATQAARLAEALNSPRTAALNRELIKLYQQGKSAHGNAPISVDQL